MSGIQLPGRVQVGVVEHENGQAFPSSTGIGQQFHIFGGLTKLEYVAAQIGGCIADNTSASTPQWAAAVVNAAEAILSECAARQAKDAPPTA